jgi:hypothetical protein
VDGCNSGGRQAHEGRHLADRGRLTWINISQRAWAPLSPIPLSESLICSTVSLPFKACAMSTAPSQPRLFRLRWSCVTLRDCGCDSASARVTISDCTRPCESNRTSMQLFKRICRTVPAKLSCAVPLIVKGLPWRKRERSELVA